MILLGEIHWFDPIKGYGFIRTKKGKDIFVHYSAIKGTGFRTLTDGEKVCYQIVRNPHFCFRKRGLARRGHLPPAF